jgi:ferric-dicitrate binding protein FerR (iron transport regulator)
MSEDRLDKALEAMRNEEPAASDLAASKERIWRRLAGAPGGSCTEFRAELREYLDGRLVEARRLLMEDHLARCAECRKAFAEMKEGRKVVAMPSARRPVLNRWQQWAIAASVAAAALYLGRDRVDALLAPSGPRAVVEVASGELYRLPEGTLRQGAPINDGEVVRTGPGARAVLRLADGSAVEVNERSELFVNAAWSGQTIHLQRGDVIVQAAKQRHGRLRVQTRDSVAAVKGTIFAVSTGISGSLVTVVEGSVQVTQPGTDRMLTRGQQSASNPGLEATPAGEAVAWSFNSEKYLALLGDFATLEKQLAALPTPALRTQPKLLQYLPANPLVYGAIPNLNGTLQRALALADQQAGESAVFQEWWSSGSGAKLKDTLTRTQAVFPMVGDEIVFVLAANTPGTGKQKIPAVIAQVLPGEEAGLTTALAGLTGVQFKLSGQLLLVSDSTEDLQWVEANLSQGASSDFASAIAQRYQQGVGWLIAIDVADMPTVPIDRPGRTMLDAKAMKYLFFEQRTAQGVEENRATLAFNGARTGFASWIAASGAGGAAEYITSDAVLAFSASTLTSLQMYQEMVARISQVNPDAQTKLQEIQTKLGINLADDVASALGTDFAFGIETPTLPMPGWVLTAEVYKPASLDASIAKLVAAFNAELKPGDQAKSITLGQQTVNGQLWNTLTSSASKQQIAWTYNLGYMIVSNDIGLGMKAIQTKASGFPLVRSAAFTAQMPSAIGVSPAGFAWLNTKGALSSLLAKIPNPALQKLAADRDPVLVVLNASTEQLQLSSRTRITSLVLDLMMTGSAAANAKRAQP